MSKIVPFILSAVCVCSGLCRTSRADDVANLAETSKTFATINGVPQSTAIADLVTKASRSAIVSGLATPPHNAQYSTSLLNALGEKSRESAQLRGYSLRPIELDPRFESNAAKVVNEINIDELSPVSPAQGLNIFPPGAQVLERTCVIMGNAVSCNEIANPSAAPPQSPPIASAQLDESNGRIYGGTPIRPEDDAFSDSVALVGNDKVCSGAMVGNDLVITAAHCVCDGVDEEVDIGTSIISPKKRIPINKKDISTFKSCEIIKKDLSLGDVALVRINDSVPHSIKPIMGLKEIRQAASVRAVGFGRTESSIGFKYQVNVVIASWQCDGSDFRGIPDHQVYLCQPSYELVAAGLNRDTCAGDSGSPIYIFGQDSKPYIAGITSRAVTPDGKCGSGGIYVLLSASPLREWLQAQGVPLVH